MASKAFTPLAGIIQANLNHSARAQDLLVQTLAEWNMGLAVAAEPYRVPDRPDWAGDALGSVAIIGGPLHPLTNVRRGRGYVVAHTGRLAVVGVYAPPSLSLAEFEVLLDGVRGCVMQSSPCPTMVLGDFNAKSTTWGSPRTDARGEAVEEWAAGLDLRLLNRGSTSTFVRRRGESIIELSWATPAAARMVAGWRVAEEVESLSDHLHIFIKISAPPGPGAPL